MIGRMIYRATPRGVAHAVVVTTTGRGEPTVWTQTVRLACQGVDLTTEQLLEDAQLGRETCKNCDRVYLERATPADVSLLKATL